MITHSGFAHTRRPIKLHLISQQLGIRYREHPYRTYSTISGTSQDGSEDLGIGAPGSHAPQGHFSLYSRNRLPPAEKRGIPASGSHKPEGYFPLYGRNRKAHERWEKRHNIPNVVPGLFPYDSEGNRSAEKLNDSLQTLHTALRSGDPHFVLKSLHLFSLQADGATLTNVLATIPPSTFSEMLRCLDPKHFVARYQRFYEEISPARAKLLSLPPVDVSGHYQCCNLLLSLIKEIVAARRKSHTFTIIDLRYLLRVARGVGNLKYAEQIWFDLTTAGRGHLEPDLFCYNDLMATICWAPIWNPNKRRKLRNVPWNLAPRSWVFPPSESQDFYLRETGVSKRISALLERMVSSGQRGTEETYCHIILGLGRDGDIQAVQTILQRVWNINVPEVTAARGNNDLTGGRASNVFTVRDWAPDSPFYPTQQLLYSIAHCYGSNNDIPTALGIIDHISTQYSIMPTENVWHELLRWAYVLSRPDLHYIGKLLHEDAVMDLVRTMVSHPYNLTPNFEMCNLAVGAALRSRKLRDAEFMIEEGRKRHRRRVRHLRRMITEVQKLDRREDKYDRKYESLSRNIHLEQAKIRHSRLTIRRWVEKFLFTDHSASLQKKLSWYAQAVPRLIKLWGSFLPYNIEYPTATGRVRFASGSFELNRELVWKANYGEDAIAAEAKENRLSLVERMGRVRKDHTKRPLVNDKRGSRLRNRQFSVRRVKKTD